MTIANNKKHSFETIGQLQIINKCRKNTKWHQRVYNKRYYENCISLQTVVNWRCVLSYCVFNLSFRGQRLHRRLRDALSCNYAEALVTRFARLALSASLIVTLKTRTLPSQFTTSHLANYPHLWHASNRDIRRAVVRWLSADLHRRTTSASARTISHQIQPSLGLSPQNRRRPVQGAAKQPCKISRRSVKCQLRNLELYINNEKATVNFVFYPILCMPW